MKTLESCTTISSNDKELLLAVKQVVHRFFPDATLLLFGSVSRGTQGSESDYDVLILTNRPFSTKEEDSVIDAIYDLELDHEIVISSIIYTKQQWDMPITRASPFHKNVEENGIML